MRNYPQGNFTPSKNLVNILLKSKLIHIHCSSQTHCISTIFFKAILTAFNISSIFWRSSITPSSSVITSSNVRFITYGVKINVSLSSLKKYTSYISTKNLIVKIILTSEFIRGNLFNVSKTFSSIASKIFNISTRTKSILDIDGSIRLLSCLDIMCSSAFSLTNELFVIPEVFNKITPICSSVKSCSGLIWFILSKYSSLIISEIRAPPITIVSETSFLLPNIVSSNSVVSCIVPLSIKSNFVTTAIVRIPLGSIFLAIFKLSEVVGSEHELQYLYLVVKTNVQPNSPEQSFFPNSEIQRQLFVVDQFYVRQSQQKHLVVCLRFELEIPFLINCFHSASINRDQINDRPEHRDMLLKLGQMASLIIGHRSYNNKYSIEVNFSYKYYKELMFFKIITVVTVLINTNAEEDIAIIVSPGAFFDEVPEAILYNKSIPLIYTQKLQDNYPDDNLENIKKKLGGLLNSRSKRGIQFFGSLYHFCCNVATEKQLKTFYTNEELLDQQFNKFKNVFASDHKDLTNITTELNKYTKNTKNNIKLLKDSSSKFINEENINNLQEKTNQENMVQAILKITNNERDTNIHLHCKLHKIPARIIKSKILYNDLTKLKN
ncbi:hypothetical protein AGLY_009030 [Aphis glycines]|uniref:Uncharacterized protein n=1 Tax=Aphis glycines TaxID=307491 RepID=A0A6G0TIU5_APHGL|nr:hypothetical protein AGLY_009030 [Aphis glycines]